MFRPFQLYPLTILDVETTDLDARRGALLQFAAIRVNPQTFEIVDKFDTFIKPHEGAYVDPKAMEVNGLDLEKLKREAPTFAEVRPRIDRITQQCIPTGQNLHLDISFLDAAYRREQSDFRIEVEFKYRVDTAILAFPLVLQGKLESTGLSYLCDHYKVSNEGKHTAMADVRRTYLVLLHLLRDLGVTTIPDHAFEVQV